MTLKSDAKKIENIYTEMENAVKRDLQNALIVQQHETKMHNFIFRSIMKYE